MRHRQGDIGKQRVLFILLGVKESFLKEVVWVAESSGSWQNEKGVEGVLDQHVYKSVNYLTLSHYRYLVLLA